jgi:cytochrome c biogenesis protein CcdA
MQQIDETTPGTTEIQPQPQPQAPEGRSALRTVGIVLGVLLFLAIIGAIGYGMVANPGLTAVIRDISIIVLALVTIVIGLFLVILVFQLQSLIALLRDEIKPILESANQTASTVRGTTTFVSDAVVRPMIEAASVAAGVGRAVKSFTGTFQKPNRKKPRDDGRA